MREEEQVGSGLLGVAFFLGILGWKSQRIKIHRLAFRFFTDFLIHTPGYGFLCGNQKDLAKVSRRLGSRIELFKIHSLVCILLWVLVVLNLFHNVLFKVLTNFKFYRQCFIKEDLRKLCIISWCLVGQKNP
jgi:hypothetical protein